eukprot:170256_1
MSIYSMPIAVPLKQTLLELIANDDNTYINTNVFWMDDSVEQKHENSILTFLKIEDRSHKILAQIIQQLCQINIERNENIIFKILLQAKFAKSKQQDKIKFVSTFIEKHLSDFPSLQKSARKWAIDRSEMVLTDTDTIINDNGQKRRINNKEAMTSTLSIENKANIIYNAFRRECETLNPNDAKVEFGIFVKNAIQIALQTCRDKYIDDQQRKRSQTFIEKAQLKAQMQSVKQMRACWYQGINNHHQVHPDQPMLIDHVLSLVLYTHCSELCTMLRETYRKIHDAETIDNQKNRHALFAHFGRLLYESFVFFGSTNYQSILYHGMSTQLLFKTLYCTFNAP